MEQKSPQQEQENLSGESAKIKKAFDSAMESLVAIFRGEKNIKPKRRIPSESVNGLMEELFSEEIKAKEEEFKSKAKSLMKSKVEYDRFLKEKEKEFQKAKDDKTKEFTKQATELLELVESIDQIKASYLESLT